MAAALAGAGGRPQAARYPGFLAESRQLAAVIWLASASFGEAQAVLAQFVVQGLARHAEGLGQAAQGAVRAVQLGADQAAFCSSRTLPGQGWRSRAALCAACRLRSGRP